MTASPRVPGAPIIAPLTGNELVVIAGVGPQISQTSTGDIAALASLSGLNPISTSITTVGAGVLTAAAIVGGVIVRSGPTSAFTDTTATAALIIAALPTGTAVGSSWILTIKNLTAFSETLAAGTGVTLSGNKDVIPANAAGVYLMSYATASTITMQGLYISSLTSGLPEASTTLSTVGAGTITAAGIAGGVTNRTGSQSNTAFTDTTDTADNIIAAIPNARIGQTFEYTYKNTTNATATIAGGTGVTVSVVTAVPANCTARFLITYTAASTMTMVGLWRTIPSTTSGTIINNGTSTVTTADTNITANSNVIITLKTVGGTVGAIPHLLTVTPGTGFATVGTASDTSTYNYLIIN